LGKILKEVVLTWEDGPEPLTTKRQKMSRQQVRYTILNLAAESMERLANKTGERGRKELKE
jgi:hypothetical protein